MPDALVVDLVFRLTRDQNLLEPLSLGQRLQALDEAIYVFLVDLHIGEGPDVYRRHYAVLPVPANALCSQQHGCQQGIAYHQAG